MRRDLGSFSLFSSDVRLTVKTLLKVDQTSSMPKLNTRHFHVWFSLLLSSRPQRTHDAKNISFDTSSSLGLWEVWINKQAFVTGKHAIFNLSNFFLDIKSLDRVS